MPTAAASASAIPYGLTTAQDSAGATDETPLRNSRAAQLFAGATAGLVSCLALQPLDVIKTRLQLVPSQNTMVGRLGFIRHDFVLAMDALGGGPRALWRGTSASVLRGVPAVAVYFGALDTLRYHMTSSTGAAVGLAELPVAARDMLAGAGARGLAVMLLMPFSVAKTRIESGLVVSSEVTTIDVLRDIARQRGIRGLWSGWGATVARDAPAGALHVATYEALKRQFGYGNGEISDYEIRTICACSAATLTAVVTHPLDVVKARVQVIPADNRNMFVAALNILRKEGAATFVNGLVPRILRKSLQAGIAWSVYEELSDNMERWQKHTR